MRRITAISLMAAAVLALTACGKEPAQTTETAPSAVISAEVTETTESAVTTAADVQVELPAWEGRWEAADTDEYFEISGLTDEGFSVLFYHFEEGQIEEFKYKMEFDDAWKTVASEPGKTDGARWEYTFNFRGDSILVQSKNPDQIYIRVAEST